MNRKDTKASIIAFLLAMVLAYLTWVFYPVLFLASNCKGSLSCVGDGFLGLIQLSGATVSVFILTSYFGYKLFMKIMK